MRPRTPITIDQVVTALNYSQGDIEVAADLLRTMGVPVSGRTLRRRIAEYGIKPRIQYEAADAA